jgi:hypothetical protein
MGAAKNGYSGREVKRAEIWALQRHACSVGIHGLQFRGTTAVLLTQVGLSPAY